jgi:putative RNA 2'-phosphotransferase
MPINYQRLSKTVAYALRHNPEEYGLTLDAEGWVAVDDLLKALRQRRRVWRGVTGTDLLKMIEQAEKRRYEIRDGRIRAYYGHSVPGIVERTPAAPPDLLFHGTSPQAAESILRDGLKPMNRQYVHLSTDRETAFMVGQRRAADPVILEVRAAEAHRAGVAFFVGNDDVWLAEAIPAQFINRP